MDGFFWYSLEQNLASRRFDHLTRFCNIKGKEYIYTEVKRGKYLRNESRWPDAVCLGYGYIARIEGLF
jgi:hypothetical protein